VDFPDEITPHTAADLEDRLFGAAYTPNMTEYYDEVSYGQLDLTGDVYGPFTMEKTYSEYGWGPDEAGEFILDAIRAADPTVDFSQYDSDGDGYVDAVVVAASEYISCWGWDGGHAGAMSTPLSVDGVIARDITSQDDDSSIGLYCHEFGHILGLPDLYIEEQVDEWCLMGFGYTLDPPAHLSAWPKVYLGWVVPTEVTGSHSAYSIPNVEENDVILKLCPANLPLDEYFLVENRQPIGTDAALPGDGLLIWHVGGGNSMAVLAMEEAGSGAGDLSAAATPFPGSTGQTEFSADSSPSSDLSATQYDKNSGISIENISASAATMTADIQVATSLYGWRGLDSGSEESLTDVHFVDTSTGWVVGANGTILCTTDSGASWTSQTSGVSADLLAVIFTDPTNGWICGESGTLLRTTDGLTWRRQFVGTTDTLVELSFANRSHGWVIGEGGTLLRTLNGGRSWSDISPDFLGDIPVRVDFVSTTTGFIACEEEYLFYTDDGGLTWSDSDLQWPGASGFYAWADNFISYVNGFYLVVNFEGNQAYARIPGPTTIGMMDMDFCGTEGVLIGSVVSINIDLAEDFFWPETDEDGQMLSLEDQSWADVHDLFSLLSSQVSAVDMVESISPHLSSPVYGVGPNGMILKHVQWTGLETHVGGALPGTDLAVEGTLPEMIELAPRDNLFPDVDPAQYYEYELLNIPTVPMPTPIP